MANHPILSLLLNGSKSAEVAFDSALFSMCQHNDIEQIWHLFFSLCHFSSQKTWKMFLLISSSPPHATLHYAAGSVEMLHNRQTLKEQYDAWMVLTYLLYACYTSTEHRHESSPLFFNYSKILETICFYFFSLALRTTVPWNLSLPWFGSALSFSHLLNP